MRHSVLDTGKRGAPADLELYERFRPILEGLHKKVASYRKARAQLYQTPLRLAGGYLWSLPSTHSPHVDSLVDAGVVGKVFHSNHGLGVSLFKGAHRTPDLSRIRYRLTGEHWFLDPRGFLLTWGSRKFPRDDSPPEGDPRTVEELLKLIHDTYYRDEEILSEHLSRSVKAH